ncbi:MAG TPA: hypothetical protein VGS79_20125, partial [Puia sp.]|nr:hypothetical protein [Puia sp.]
MNLGPYSSNTLFKNTYTDDQGNVSVEFTNNAGQLVLKKVEISKSHPTPHGGWICTYHIYDDRGLLRFIIQPEGVNYLEANGWSFAGMAGQLALSGWCYRYEYDDEGRLTLKQEPGTEPKQMVYNNRDRMVFTQDGNQNDKASKEWTAILYDGLDRPVLTALYETTATAQQLQSQIPVSNTSTSLSAPGATVSAFNSPLAAADLNNSAVTTVLKYEFYDDYTYPGAKSFRTDFDNGLAYTNGDPISPTQRTLSLPTGKLVRVMETNNFLETSTYYDEKGRA